jgi:hypothetical protein
MYSSLRFCLFFELKTSLRKDELYGHFLTNKLKMSLSKDELLGQDEHKVLFFGDFLEALCRITTCKTLDHLASKDVPTALMVNPVAMKLRILVPLLIDGIKSSNRKLKNALNSMLGGFEGGGEEGINEQVAQCVITKLKEKRKFSLQHAQTFSANFQAHRQSVRDSIKNIYILRLCIRLQAIARGISLRRNLTQFQIEKTRTTKLKEIYLEVHARKIQRFVREAIIRTQRFNHMKQLIQDSPCPGGGLLALARN